MVRGDFFKRENKQRPTPSACNQTVVVCQRNLSKKKKQHWAEDKPKFDNARQLNGLTTSIRKTRNSMKPFKMRERSLEWHVDSAMPCKSKKYFRNSPQRRQRAHKRKFAMSSGNERVLVKTIRKNRIMFAESAFKRLKTEIMKIT